MTVVHVAIFKWKPEVTPERIAAVLEKVRALAHQVPGIRSIHCGTNQTNRAPGFTHAIVVLFDSPAAMEAYNTHPAHKAVGAEIDEVMADRIIGVDFTD